MAIQIESGALATKQTMYANKMIPKIKEEAGDKLQKYCEVIEGEGGEAEFYRIGEATTTFTDGDISKADGTDGSAFNLYQNDGDADTDESFTKDLEVIISGENVSSFKIARTKLGVSSATMNKHARNIGRKKDKQIIDAIKAVKTDSNYTAKVTEVAITGSISDDEVVKKILAVVAQSVSESSSSDEHRSDVAVLINSKDHAALYENQIFTSSDFSGMVNKGDMKNIFSAKFESYKGKNPLIAQSEIIVMPAETVGVGIAPGGEDASITWADGIKKYQVSASTMRCAAVTDPESITHITITAKP